MAIMTRSEFVSYIKEEFPRTDKDSFIVTCLDDTLYDLTTMYDFDILTSESEISLVADTYQYSFPSSFSMLLGDVKYFDAGNNAYLLNKRNKKEFDELWTDLTTSSFPKTHPSDFAIWGDKIYIAPYLSSVTTEKIVLTGVTLSSKLSSDSSQPQFEDEWREVIKRGVLGRLYESLEEFNLADRQYSLYQRGIEKMKNVDETKSSVIETIMYRGY